MDEGVPSSAKCEEARATASQIRRAAGGRDTSRLARLISTGWSCSDLDAMASDDGKSALHMAAWYGPPESIELLLDLGCDVDAVATGRFSYGKSPIFFSITRCRDDACRLLLRRGASVRIVNNKGQTPLSLASSHLSAETVELIRGAEAAQEGTDWINYRETHSDGNIYGDIDPRFLERPLQPDDVVTELAINPTTQQSRRGNFARNNPKVAKEVERKKNKKKAQSKVRKPPPEPTADQIEEYERAWERVKFLMRDSAGDSSYEGLLRPLLQIVRFGEQRRQPWLGDASRRLREYVDDSRCRHTALSVESIANFSDELSDRERVLLSKLFRAINGADDSSCSEEEVPREIEHIHASIMEQKQCWRAASDAVRGLSREELQNPDVHQRYLSLPELPFWVDSLGDLQAMDKSLCEFAENGGVVVALDTEWYDSECGAAVATLQVALVESSQCRAWVVDLLPMNKEYQSSASKVIHWILNDSGMDILGFSIGHDIPKLSAFVGSTLPSNRCLDLQPIAASKMADRGDANYRRSHLPGLKACCEYFLSLDTSGEEKHWELSKEQQCSDWGVRPLSEEQLRYAGLDAAVLLVLLSELDRSKQP